jgi:hypothetical protein
MEKIPTIFERDWDGDRSRVLDQVTPGCEWVFAGEGVATRKLDGTCCMIRDGVLYKRHEVRPGKVIPDGFEHVSGPDAETGKVVGWVRVGDGPEDRWHREAWEDAYAPGLRDGTYELIGPKVQGNPEGLAVHELVPHTVAALAMLDPERTFDGIRDVLQVAGVEGIVFHHEDGRMAKIKARDFGIRRGGGAFVRTVWKFPLEVTDWQEIEMPQDAEILHVGDQSPATSPRRTLEVWALVDPNNPRVARKFAIHGTGHPVTEGGTHIGSIITAGGALVWHVFDHGE